MKANEIALEIFPEAEGEFLEALIWSTGFPYFWSIPRDGNTPEECFRKQLQQLKVFLEVQGRFPEPEESLDSPCSLVIESGLK